MHRKTIQNKTSDLAEAQINSRLKRDADVKAKAK